LFNIRAPATSARRRVNEQPSDRRGLQADTPWPLDKEQAVKMYRAMVGLQTMDVVFYDSQRQAKAPWRGLATAPCLLRAQPRVVQRLAGL